MSDGKKLHDSLHTSAPSWGELRADVNHGDKAYEFLNSAPFNHDPEVVRSMISAADVHARLFVADKIEELITAMRECTAQVLDGQRHLYGKGEQLHRDAQELKQQLRVIRGEAA